MAFTSRNRVVLVALGFDTDGRKHVLGIREGSTENTRVARSLISDLIERGLDADTPRLWIIDRGKALRRAITEVFGAATLVHRCQEHKRRNVLDHLPKHLHESVGRAMKDAWHSKNAVLAKPFRSTNPIENLNGLIAHYTCNVKRWRDGEMVLRRIGTAPARSKRRLPHCARVPRHEASRCSA